MDDPSEHSVRKEGSTDEIYHGSDCLTILQKLYEESVSIFPQG